jgi:hypothetical protein
MHAFIRWALLGYQEQKYQQAFFWYRTMRIK